MADRASAGPRMLFGGLRSRPWRLSARAAAGDLHDFGYSPGFQSTLSSTVATRVPMWLGEIQVPVRVAYGTLDLMLGVFTAPRFAVAIPQAELVPLPGVGHVPMLDDPELVARTILDFTADADTPPRRPVRGQAAVAGERPAQVTRRRLLFLVTCCRLDNCLGPPGVGSERPARALGHRHQLDHRRVSPPAPRRAGVGAPPQRLRAACASALSGRHREVRMIEVDRVDSAEIDNCLMLNVRVLAARSTSRSRAQRTSPRGSIRPSSDSGWGERAARRSRSGLALGSAAVRAVGAACRTGKRSLSLRPALIGCRKPTISKRFNAPISRVFTAR